MILRLPLADLSPAERTRFLYSVLGFMCVASAALVGRTVGDAIFLSAYSPSLLSYMYVGTAIVLSVVSYSRRASGPAVSSLLAFVARALARLKCATS